MQNRTWLSSDKKYSYVVKFGSENSRYGLDGGKITELRIRTQGENVKDLCNYCGGDWSVEPAEEVRDLFSSLVKCYN
jgi:hypothetical protein